MLWFEVHATDFKRIIQSDDIVDAIEQFKAMHPNDYVKDIKSI